MIAGRVPRDAAAPRVLPGVDTLRFVAAAWVAVAHGGLSPFTAWLAATTGRAGQLVEAAVKLTNGGTAVALFFILSGLCIHYPNAGSRRVDMARFYTKRLVRIVPPLLIGMLVASGFGEANRAFFDLALWSIYSEITYYVLYPLLMLALRGRDMGIALAASGAISAIMLLSRPGTDALWSFGLLTWLYAAPLWLAGAWLAERIRLHGFVPVGSVWLWRGAMLATSTMASMFEFHFPIVIGFAWSAILVGIIGTVWIAAEIAHFTHRPPVRLLEAMGLACYSSYLMHTVAIVFARQHLAAIAPIGSIVSIIVLSASFYLLVERPCHRLAQFLGRRVRVRVPQGIAADGPI